MYFNKKQLIMGMMVVAVFGSQPVFSFSLLEWLGFKDSEQSTQHTGTQNSADDQAAVKSKVADAEQSIDVGKINEELELTELKMIFANLSAEQRKLLLSDSERFAELIKQQLALKSVLKAAVANNLHKDANTLFLMKKTAENALRELYLKRLIAEKLPADFPSDEQIQTFYEENKERFVVEQRVHLWQIFLPFGENQDIEAIKSLEAQANSIVKEIEKDKISFNEAAGKHSRHQPSRNNGGYMGLVKVSDILPAIKEKVLELKQEQVSQPLKTEAGIHILRRGEIVEAQNVELAEAREQIKAALRQEAGKRFQQAVIEQSQKSYPIEITDKKVEEWRLKLRTNL